MGAVCKGQNSALVIGTVSYPAKILLLGLPGTGKTVLLHFWLHGKDAIEGTLKPTQHFNVELVTSPSRLVFMVYDLSGHIGCHLRPFLDGTEGIVFLLSNSDHEKDKEMQWVYNLSKERDLRKAAFLFISQSSDSEPAIEDKLQTWFEGRLWSLHQISSLSQQSAKLVLGQFEALIKQPVDKLTNHNHIA